MKTVPTFKEYMMRYLEEDDPFGDLAEDIKGDKNFPNSRCYEPIRTYLLGRRACRECLDTFVEAFDDYMGEKRMIMMQRERA